MLKDIIHIKELKKDLKIKERTEKDYIKSYAFSMFRTHSSTDSNVCNILRIAKDMGFHVDKKYNIHFDSVEPGSEADAIMVEVNRFKNDIINQINESIKKFKERYDGYNTIEITINLETILNKYNVYPLLFHKSYNLQWLKDELHTAGYDDCMINYIGINSDCLIYKIYINLE